MAIRYFKKVSPMEKLWMSNGHHLKFRDLGKFAYLKSDDPEINEDPKTLAEIDAGMKNKVGGVSEISATQYDDEFVKKNSTTQSGESNRRWREEFGQAVPMDTLAPRVSREPAAVAESTGLGATVETTPRVPSKSLREMANLGHR